MNMRMQSLLAGLLSLLLLPAAAYAQAAIAGVVKDSSGAVLPGVTVEASSPVLIEKTRAAVTDGSGQYRIENLRPGPYSVSYTLAGFSTVLRTGIELTGSFTATVNADLRVGTLAETVTVTGESPIVDVQGTTRERVMDHDVIDAVPAGRGVAGVYNLALLIPGVSQGSATTTQDVGGSSGTYLSRLKVHGSDDGDQLLTQNGASLASINDSAAFNPIGVNLAATKETSVDTAAVNAEFAKGGVRINIIPKDGGNAFEGTLFSSFANGSMQGHNLGQDLKDRGLPTTNTLKKTFDINPGLGGPLKHDKLWFFLSGMYTGNSVYTAGMYENLNFNDPNAWTYAPDLKRPAFNDQTWKDGQLRLTWQATSKHKLGLVWHDQVNCECPQGTSATAAPETSLYARYPVQRTVQGDWTAPLTNRVLLEISALKFIGTSDNGPLPNLNPAMVSVTEQSTGLTFRAGNLNYRNSPNQALHTRGAISYVTGAHAFKLGFNHTSGWARDRSPRATTLPAAYRFNNGVTNQITEAAYPHTWQTNVDHDMGIYAQDKWTIHRLTASYGARFDYFKSSFPEQHLGATAFTPTRDITFPAGDGVSLKDLTPKLGAAYDLFGNGKTAIKVTANKYLQGLASIGISAVSNPVNRIIVQTTRSWADANRDYVPNCNLMQPDANGECGAMAQSAFGTTNPGASFDPDILEGWGKRFYNWEMSAGVQHELLPRMSIDVSYFRRWFGNFAVTDNTLVAPSDYTRYSVTAPKDSRLPGGGGYTVSGVYDLNPNKVGQVADYVTFADNFGTMTRHFNGVDVNVGVRPRNGLLIQGGVSTGREDKDFCDVIPKLPEVLSAARAIGTRVGALATIGYVAGSSAQFCHQSTGFITQVKVLGSYTIPRLDVLASATFQSIPGPQILAQYVAPNAVVAPSLGRSLSGNAANATVGLVSSGSMFGEQSNQLDLRLGKVLRAAKTRTTVNFDLYNALNANPVLRQNDNFGSWQVPTVILAARLIKIGVQFDF